VICLVLTFLQIRRNLSTHTWRHMSMAIVTRHLRSISALLTLSLLVVVSACGASPGTGGAASSPPTSVSADQQATTTAPSPAQQVLSGVIIEGLRSTCRILQTSQRRYALTGAASQRLGQGDKVTVTGVERTDLVNPCGLTFVVTSTR
jgi:hypothetical protein